MDNNTLAFLALLKAGIWEKDVLFSQNSHIDYNIILKLAEEQSVVGLVTAGLEHVRELSVPKDIALSFVGQSLLIEQRNKLMNSFIANVYERLRNDGVFAVLIKGQGIAQCYNRPFWRASGDIDLFLDEKNYKLAKESISTIASRVMEEDLKMKHWDANVGDYEIELHGTMRSLLLSKMDNGIDLVQSEMFNNNQFRYWRNGIVEIALPSADNDIIIVFTHIIKHFFHEGVGLRQVCDLCRLIWTYRDVIDKPKLGARLKNMGVMTEWHAFAYLMVNYLGMPEVSMPFYSEKNKWKKKANRILSFIFATGNFGHNRDNSYYRRLPYLTIKIISLTRHLSDYLRYFFIFPLDSARVTIRGFQVGFSAILNGR